MSQLYSSPGASSPADSTKYAGAGSLSARLGNHSLSSTGDTESQPESTTTTASVDSSVYSRLRPSSRKELMMNGSGQHQQPHQQPHQQQHHQQPHQQHQQVTTTAVAGDLKGDSRSGYTSNDTRQTVLMWGSSGATHSDGAAMVSGDITPTSAAYSSGNCSSKSSILFSELHALNLTK